jgi:bacterioferritin (cytochrome b1)
MKGNEKLIAALNGLLADELTAINQYVVHAEMAENWGYGKLKKFRTPDLDLKSFNGDCSADRHFT